MFRLLTSLSRRGQASLRRCLLPTPAKRQECRLMFRFTTSVQSISLKTRLQGQRCLSLHFRAQTARLTLQERLKKQAQRLQFLLLTTFHHLQSTKLLTRWLRKSNHHKSSCFRADSAAVTSRRAQANSLPQHSVIQELRRLLQGFSTAVTVLCSVYATASRHSSSSVLCLTAKSGILMKTILPLHSTQSADTSAQWLTQECQALSHHGFRA